MSTTLLWLLIAVSDGGNNAGNVSVVARFVDVRQCEATRQAIAAGVLAGPPAQLPEAVPQAPATSKWKPCSRCASPNYCTNGLRGCDILESLEAGIEPIAAPQQKGGA